MINLKVTESQIKYTFEKNSDRVLAFEESS